jgi:hypothetical protein
MPDGKWRRRKTFITGHAVVQPRTTTGQPIAAGLGRRPLGNSRLLAIRESCHGLDHGKRGFCETAATARGAAATRKRRDRHAPRRKIILAPADKDGPNRGHGPVQTRATARVAARPDAAAGHLGTRARARSGPGQAERMASAAGRRSPRKPDALRPALLRSGGRPVDARPRTSALRAEANPPPSSSRLLLWNSSPSINKTAFYIYRR